MSAFDLRHALAVAREFDYGTTEWLVALLHDAVEDGALGMSELRELGLPTEIVEGVYWLTRHVGESYFEYIHSVSRREITCKVKAADLRANLARMNEAHESLRPRYEKALVMLTTVHPAPAVSGDSGTEAPPVRD